MSSCTVAVATDTHDSYEVLISTLPSIQGPYTTPIYLYKGCWLPKPFLIGTIGARDHFTARPTDLFLCSFPKSGTTWLKALMFCIITRADHPDLADHPLLRANPHSYVQFLEDMHTNRGDSHPDPIEPCLSVRLLASHMPYSILPESIKNLTGYRIVYLCREPKDTLISFWKFLTRLHGRRVELEEFMEDHLRGEGPFGPMWDHVLSYWRESRRNPDKVLFLKYEELKKDAEGVLKRLAEFMGYPFSPEEEEDGVVRRISELCSFGSLSKLEVNRSDRVVPAFGLVYASNLFFRKGEVGDWTNYLTPEMAKRFDDVIEAKLHGSDLTFNDRGGS